MQAQTKTRAADVHVGPQSHSSLNTYTECPKKFYHLKIAKDVQDAGSPAMAYGTAVHKSIELYLKNNIPFPLQTAHWKPIADWTKSIPGELHCELRLAMTVSGEACGYFDKHNCYLRGNGDAIVVNGDRAVALDWKTSVSKYGTKGQDARYAILIFANYERVETVETRFVFPKDGTVLKGTFRRDDAPTVQAASVDLVVAEMKWSAAHNAYPAKPSGLCPWCPVGKAGLCPEAQEGRKKF